MPNPGSTGAHDSLHAGIVQRLDNLTRCVSVLNEKVADLEVWFQNNNGRMPPGYGRHKGETAGPRPRSRIASVSTVHILST